MESPLLARDIMATRLITMSPHQPVFESIPLLLRHQITGSPVVDEERQFLGVLSEKCCMGLLALTARLAAEAGEGVPEILARDFMTSKLVTFGAETDAVEAIGKLLKYRISGAPVVDDKGTFLGVFSEKFSMSLLLALAHDQSPSSAVGPFMNTERGRVVDEETPLLEIIQRFLDTPYRRLPVLRDGKLLGQISRRDVLRAAQRSPVFRRRDLNLVDHSADIDRSAGSPEASHGKLDSNEVVSFMDSRARTISPNADLLSIAQIFLSTPYRRLPVVRKGKLLGQVSRRDVLQATFDLMKARTSRRPEGLYLSATRERYEAPFA